MSFQQKHERAVAWLGSRYILHPSRRVQRLKLAEQNDIHKADVPATIKRVTKLLEKGQT